MGDRVVLTFALDFDGTFAAAPELFREFAALIRKNGHQVIMVTQRCAKFADDIAAVVQDPELPVLYANGMSKEDAAALWGYVVNVWVDDSPFSVHTALRYRDCP